MVLACTYVRVLINIVLVLRVVLLCRYSADEVGLLKLVKRK